MNRLARRSARAKASAGSRPPTVGPAAGGLGRCHSAGSAVGHVRGEAQRHEGGRHRCSQGTVGFATQRYHFFFSFPSANIETAASVCKKKKKKRPCLNAVGEMATVPSGSVLQDLGKRYFKSLIPLVRTQERLLAL